MGMPAAHPPVSTIEDLLALPEDGLRHELLDGEHVVTPAPELPHQGAVGEFLLRLHSALAGRIDLRVFVSPADVVLGSRTLVQPDVFVVAKLPDRPLRRWADVGVPLVAIEVLSPGTAARDRGKKRDIYQRAGVAEYWIVDLDAELVERWRPTDERPEILRETLAFSLPGGAAGMIDLRELFAAVSG